MPQSRDRRIIVECATVESLANYLILRKKLSTSSATCPPHKAIHELTMRLIKEYIDRDGSGSVTLLPEDPEDMVCPSCVWLQGC